MGAHTPGPWVFVPYREHDHAWRRGEGDLGGFKSGDKWVCRFGDSTTYYPCEGEVPNEADAHLIAAAPDLLAALEAMVRMHEEGASLVGLVSQVIAGANAAIARARGDK